MKRFVFFFLSALLLLTASLEAQTLRNANNARVGKIESDGTIRNANNATIGRIDSDGTVRNANNASIGRIESDGTVRNANGASIGKASGVDRKIAAVLFFMHILE